ncbi:hypothetical protein TTHERM_00188970 (macronuclear) [Tetrahymena thermophila SB210]|uniref:Uncharacterized protein n=1 Tax=Tetrahymena thermophila (strain SB210) TaxID=312017 RepID=I7MEG8_TETTS|nr:hypothetical protein TTHERM_00188970 [Tetrahymena thermophila SB210]EAR96328.1 hypothetical protein TTHERM_00188970 [Tetrahymena thermophila SB210]|eukprot:XP_001016573.1 hypothetical protein TTHERM_00188970 [Tetrahymena thermophila SB210]
MNDPLIKNSSGSYNKVSSDLKHSFQMPSQSQIQKYLQYKEKEIQQFQLTESPQNQKQQRINEDKNGIDDSFEYRSLMPSQDFFFSNSKKSTEMKDKSKVSIDQQNSSLFNNLQDQQLSDLKAKYKVNTNEFTAGQNHINNDKNEIQEHQFSANKNRNTEKVYDTYIDGNNYYSTANQNNPFYLNEKSAYQESSQDPTLSSAGVDYYFKNGIIKKENIDDHSLKQNHPTFLTNTPTKDSSRFLRSNSDYQRSYSNNLIDDENRYLKNRSSSYSKYNFSGTKNISLHQSKVNDQTNNYNNNEFLNANAVPIQQQASFRNLTDFYSVQLPENNYPHSIANSLTYSASQEKKYPHFNYSSKSHYNLNNKDQINNIAQSQFQRQPFSFEYKQGDNLTNSVALKQLDIQKDSSNLLNEMKVKQQNHEKKLQDILRDSYDLHHKQTEEYYLKKQQKDFEIQKQYQELQKFGQSTSHFNQNSHYDPIPDISEIKDLNHSNMSGFMNRDSYDPYTPNSSAYKNQLKNMQKQHQSEHPSFLKSSFVKENNYNSLHENQQSGHKQFNIKGHNSYILEVDDSFQTKNNQTYQQKENEKQLEEIYSLKKQLKDDETERLNQKRIQQEQQKRIEFLEKEISNLNLKLKEALQAKDLSKRSNYNSNGYINSNNISDNNSSKTTPHSQPGMRSSKSESKPNNNPLKIVNNFELNSPHNLGSGMTFNSEQKFRFKVIELLQVENDEEILQKIKHLVQYKKQNESFTKCVVDTMEQLAPEGYFKNKKPTIAQSWKYMKHIMQQYINLTLEKKKLKQLAKQLSEVIAKGLDADSQDLQNSIRNILIL